MNTAKQEALNAISSLPDTATIDDIMYRLYAIDKINRGLEAIDRGETLTIDELRKEAESW